jgi:tetratricopeptide (TPR) repeat protein
MTVVGRGGTGKTALVCRLLKALESGQLPDDGGALAVDGIVYLSGTGSRRLSVPNLYADLSKLLPDETAARLDGLYKQPQVSTAAKMRALLEEFPSGRVVLLLDNFEDVVDPATFALTDAELDEALRALLSGPPHGISVIITTRVAPRDLLLLQPGRQRRLNLDAGLLSPFAENILREMDADGSLGLRDAPDALLAQARERTRGYPRALEALAAILSADRDTSLQEILDSTQEQMHEHIVAALVGEAYSRLDLAAQQVMQALAVYNRPVTPAAVDYLLQPYTTGINSAPVLGRLVNMQFARKEAGRYYLHPVDRAYAFGRVPEGNIVDRRVQSAPYTQFALLHRGAEYFKQTRKPRAEWKTIEDLAPQLAEFELRYEGQDYDAAADVLTDIDFDYLLLWGYYRLMAELHERLQGKIADPILEQISVGRLGAGYRYLGRYKQAIVCYEQALNIARSQVDRRGEGAWLGNLGNCYVQLGQTQRAREHYERSLIIAREISDRRGESNALGSLANRYAELGQVQQAIKDYEQQLTITREIGDRLGEGLAKGNLSIALIDEGKYQESLQLASEAVQIGVEISSPLLGSYGNYNTALAHLYLEDLSAAHTAAESALQFDEPQNNHNVLALLGVIALRQNDQAAAREAFTAAISHADQLIEFSGGQNYEALDAKGLALSGLALLDGPQHIPAAVAAYHAARAITTAAGIVGRVLRLHDALAVADEQGLLAEVRAAAQGV